MLSNNVVNEAVKDRNKLPYFKRGKLIANEFYVWLVIYPVNSLYVEQPIGHYNYTEHNGKVERSWSNYG